MVGHGSHDHDERSPADSGSSNGGSPASESPDDRSRGSKSSNDGSARGKSPDGKSPDGMSPGVSIADPAGRAASHSAARDRQERSANSVEEAPGDSPRPAPGPTATPVTTGTSAVVWRTPWPPNWPAGSSPPAQKSVRLQRPGHGGRAAARKSLDADLRTGGAEQVSSLGVSGDLQAAAGRTRLRWRCRPAARRRPAAGPHGTKTAAASPGRHLSRSSVIGGGVPGPGRSRDPWDS